LTVRSAVTVAEALAVGEAFSPDVALLDVMLPDMDGFEVARRLRADRAPVRIIFLTARDTRQDRSRGRASGGDDYVTKPLGLEELVARVRPVLAGAERV
jgi:two-component system, OmpR family, response regulator